MFGERRFCNAYGQLNLPEGCYGRDLKKRWWCRPPGGNTIPLGQFDVDEHKDGTISVNCTISINGFTGHLVNGIWMQIGEPT